MSNPRSERPSPEDGDGSSSEPTPQDEALFLANLPVIEAAIRHVCRRNHLNPSEADDFASEVRVHLIERRYGPLRKFQGRSSMRTYLVVVIQNLFMDYRNHLWGRWRPSALARRHGPLGILLERLITRDGYTCAQALETIRINHGVDVDEALRTLAAQLAQRPPARQFVQEREADGVESGLGSSDANVIRKEHDFLAKQVRTTLHRVRQKLTVEDRLILKMRFEDAVPVADIARALRLNQKRLYPRIKQLLEALRAGLEEDGIRSDDISELLDDTRSEDDSDADQ